MKNFTKRSLLQKIIITVLATLLILNFIMPNIILAKDEDESGIGGVLFKPIQYLVLGLGDTAMWLVNTCAYGEEIDPILTLSTSTWPWYYKAAKVANLIVNPTASIGMGLQTVVAHLFGQEGDADELMDQLFPDKIDIPIFLVSPEKIFSNEVPLLDVNIINPNTNYTYVDESGNTKEIQTPAMALHETIAGWYVALRNLSIVGLLSILVYVGIRIILSSTASDKAKYKQMFIDWLVALCILFFIHYIMSFSVTMVESLTDSINKSNKRIEIPFTPQDLGGDQGKYNVTDEQYKVLKSLTLNDSDTGNISLDLMGLARFKAQLNLKSQDTTQEDVVAEGGRSQMAYTIIYIVLVIYTVMFLFIYIKRLIYIIFLTTIAPLVALTYPIDKMNDGQAQAFNMWLKEYIFNLLIQPMHLILYSILLGSAMELATDYLIYPLVVLGFMLPAEKILRKFFGFEKSSTAASLAGGALGGAAVMNAINKIGTGAKKAIKGGKGGASSSSNGNGNSENSKIRMANRTADNPDGEDDFIRESLNAGNEDDKGQYSNVQDNNQPFESDNENDNPYEQPNYGEPEDQLSPEEMAEQDPNYMYMHPELFDESYQQSPQVQNEGNTEEDAKINTEGLGDDENNEEVEEKAIKGPKKWDGVKATARYVLPSVGKGLAKGAFGAAKLSAKAIGAGTLGTIGIAAGLASDDYKNVLTYGASAATIGSGIGSNVANKIENASSTAIRLPSNIYRKASDLKEVYQKGAYSKDQYKQFVNKRLDKEFMKDKDVQKLYEAEFGRTKMKNTSGENVEAYKVAMEKALKYREHGVTDNETIIKAMKVKSRNVSGEWDDKRRIISAKLASQVSNEKDVETIQKRLTDKGVNDTQVKEQAEMIRKIKGLY